MKKTLLFCLPMILALASCAGNSPGDDGGEGSPTANPTQVQILIGEAKEELSEHLNEVSQMTKRETLLEMIGIFKNQEFSYLDTIEDEDEAEYALDVVTEHECSYVEDYFRPKAVNDLTSYVYGIVENTDNRDISCRTLEIYDYHRPELDDLENTFTSVLESTERIYGEIESFLEEYGYYVEKEDFNYIIEDIYDYTYGLLYEYEEFLDMDSIIAAVRVKLSVFKDIDTEENALKAAEEIKGQIYTQIFDAYKEGLVGAYLNFLDEIDENIKNSDAKNYVFSWKNDDVAAIRGEGTFERAYQTYDGSIDVITRELSERIRHWGQSRLEGMYGEYEGTFSGTDYEKEYYTGYVRSCTMIECLSCYIMDIEVETNKIIDDFITFIDEMLQKKLGH